MDAAQCIAAGFDPGEVIFLFEDHYKENKVLRFKPRHDNLRFTNLGHADCGPVGCDGYGGCSKSFKNYWSWWQHLSTTNKKCLYAKRYQRETYLLANGWTMDGHYPD